MFVLRHFIPRNRSKILKQIIFTDGGVRTGPNVMLRCTRYQEKAARTNLLEKTGPVGNPMKGATVVVNYDTSRTNCKFAHMTTS